MSRIIALRNCGLACDAGRHLALQSDHLEVNRCPGYFTNGTTEAWREEVTLAGGHIAQGSANDSSPSVFVGLAS